MTELSIVIPCYNEENRIIKALNRISDYIDRRGIKTEIIIVDDGSKDQTVNKVKNFNTNIPLKIHSFFKNRGKGAAVKWGMLKARGKLILFSDADLSTPIEEYEKLEKEITQKEYDIAIGSRGLAGSEKIVPQNFFRDKMGKLFGLLVRIMLLPGIRDSQCGFKLFKREVAKDVFSCQTVCGFGFDPEILFISQKKGYKIKEVPIVWKNSFETKLSPFKDSVFIGYELIKIKIKNLLGHYNC
ncbi:MAG: dolichyl-phosphate beta-glucosyltransferase [Elusimicrobiota bacterium]